MAAKQLTRSREKKLMGVAGGIAEYLDMDRTIWRAITVFVVIIAPPMALAYLVLGLVMPDAPSPAPAWQGPGAPAPAPTWQAPVAPAPAAPVEQAPVATTATPAEEGAPSATVEPAAAEPQPAELRAAEPQPGPAAPQPGPDAQQNGPWQQPPFQAERQAYKPLTKSRDKWLAGVCGGIADYFNVDPVLVRALWLAAVFFFGTGLLLYVILAILLPPPVYQTRV